jgi:hypothetical protein
VNYALPLNPTRRLLFAALNFASFTNSPRGINDNLFPVFSRRAFWFYSSWFTDTGLLVGSYGDFNGHEHGYAALATVN